MSDLSKQILEEFKADKTKPEPIKVFGRDLFIKRRSFGEKTAGDALALRENGNGKREVDQKLWAASVVVTTLVDAEGQPVFSAGQLEAVAGLDETEVDKVFQAAAKFNRLDREAVEEARKN